MSKLPTHSKPVSQVMGAKNSELQQLFQKVRDINRLKKCVMPLLDDIVRPYADISYDFKETLIILVANDAIALRLRFQTDELIKRFQKHSVLHVIKKVNVKIQSHKQMKHKKAPPPPLQVALLSEESADMVHTIAETMTHPALKSAMERIAKRIKR